MTVWGRWGISMLDRSKWARQGVHLHSSLLLRWTSKVVSQSGFGQEELVAQQDDSKWHSLTQVGELLAASFQNATTYVVCTNFAYSGSRSCVEFSQQGLSVVAVCPCCPLICWALSNIIILHKHKCHYYTCRSMHLMRYTIEYNYLSASCAKAH